MKKVKKLKIIEEGRICNPEELEEILGGTKCNKYDNCGWFFHETCRIATSAYGFESYGGKIYCDEGYYYSSCSFRRYSTCGGAVMYKNY